MEPAGPPRDDRAAAIARRHAAHAAVCDTLTPWAHGTVALAPAFPRYWDFNALRVEGSVPATLTAERVATEADRHLGHLSHRKAEIEDETTGAKVAAGLGRLGWHVDRLVHMRRAAAGCDAGAPAVGELSAGQVADLRTEWYLDEGIMPDAAGIRDFLVEEDAARARLPGRLTRLGEPAKAFVTVRIEADGVGEIEDAYVTPSARGNGLGTALLRAAITRATRDGVRVLWILADADGRPRELYARLGFAPIWTHWDCVRRPV
jgi:GNAT superfamily N-acetyltransferase